MNRFFPLASHGHYDIVELPGPTPQDAPTRMLHCELSADDGLGALEMLAQPGARGSPPLVLAADDHAVLRGLLEEQCSEAPSRTEPFGQQSLRVWRTSGSAANRKLKDALDHLLVRPVVPLPAKERVAVAVVPLSDPGLRFLPVHRGLRALPSFQLDRFLTIVSEYARVYDLESPLDSPLGLAMATAQLASLATGHHAVLLVLPNATGKILRFRQALDLVHLKAAPKSPTLRSLDLALLNALVFRTVLGLQDPESVPNEHVVPLFSLQDLAAGVQQGELQAGFALNPVPLWEVRAVMEAQQSLPPFTTRLEPRPLTLLEGGDA
jgi:hypothetical protein